MPFPALRQGPTLLFTLDSARWSDKLKVALSSIDFLSLTEQGRAPSNAKTKRISAMAGE
jgi:hypothetical protein